MGCSVLAMKLLHMDLDYSADWKRMGFRVKWSRSFVHPASFGESGKNVSNADMGTVLYMACVYPRAGLF